MVDSMCVIHVPLCLLLIVFAAEFQFTNGVTFNGGTMSFSFQKNGKLKIDLLEGFALGEGPCGPHCSVSDLGRNTLTSRKSEIASHGGDIKYFGYWTIEKKVHFVPETKDITSQVEQDKVETLIAVSEKDKWEQERSVVEITPPSNPLFEIDFDGKKWRDLDYQKGANPEWHLQIQISKGVRNDTALPNRSPISLAKPVYRLSLNKKHVIKLPYTDPDQDKVKCQRAKYVESSLNGHDLPIVHVEESCVVTVEAKTSDGYRDNTWGCVQVSMRDYNTKTISITNDTQPFRKGNGVMALSAIPIQFLNVSGEPIFVDPTIEAQHLFEIFSGATFSVEVFAQPDLNDTTREISEFIATSRTGEIFHIKVPLQSDGRPKVMKTSVSWTTTSADIGGHIVCIRVQDNKGLESVDQRCYTIRVHDAHLVKSENMTHGPEIVAVPDSSKLKCTVNSTCTIPIYAKQHGIGSVDKFIITRQSGKNTVGPVKYAPTDPVGPYIGNVVLSTHELGNNLVCLKAVDNFTQESEEKCLHFDVQPNDPCFEIPCKHGAVCIAVGNDYKCSCNSNFFQGMRCEKVINQCEAHHPCQNGGTCKVPPSMATTYRCTCPTGFTGRNCETNIDDCRNVTCSNHGQCIDKIGDHECHCFPGYSGRKCESDINECSPNPCMNGGLCTDKVNGFTCKCQSGSTGVVCNGQPLPCKSLSCFHGECENVMMTTAVCHCHVGYNGKNCSTLTDTPSGIKAHFVQPTPHNGGVLNCLAMKPCTLPVHYMTGTSGKQPNLELKPIPPDLHVTEGTATQDPLIKNAFHKNLTIDGFKPGVKKFCLQLTSTNGSTDDHVCYTVVSHAPTSHPDPTKPHFVNPTLPDNSKLLCTAQAACHIPVTTTTNGSLCEHIQSGVVQGLYVFSPDKDSDGNCMTDISFKPNLTEVGTQQKICLKASSDGEKRCFVIDIVDKKDPCVNVTCLNGGDCMQLNSTDTECVCMVGFAGRLCEKNIDDCVTNHCQNGATCVDDVNKYTCKCAPGFTGTFCETNIDECKSNPCQNGGFCKDKVNGFECICNPGFNGTHCENKLDGCMFSKCQNGKCVAHNLTSATCHCHMGYAGKQCDTLIDTPTGPKAHFVEPSPGNGGVINCLISQPCTVPVHYVTGTSGKQPNLQVTPVPPGFNVTMGKTNPDGNITHKFETDVTVHGSKPGVKKFCLQLFTAGSKDDSVCYTVISRSPTNIPDTSKPHFLSPTLQNNSTLPCKAGTICHIPVVTTPRGNSCNEVTSGAIHGLYIFPITMKNGTCVTDVSYKPDIFDIVKKHNICIQASPDGEERCITIDVVNNTDPCAAVVCKNGGACMRHGDKTTECICQKDFTGKHCETMIDPCLHLNCHSGECEKMNQTAVCHCHVGFGGHNCSLVTDVPNGSKAHFVQPSPGNGGVITCLPMQTCTVPMHYVTGTSGKQPDIEVRPRPPGLNVTLGKLEHDPNNTHKYGQNVVIHGLTNGTKKLCMQLINYQGHADDSVCYTVVSEPSPDHPDLNKPHFVNPTLQNNSVVPCTVGTTCHVPVITTANGSSCVHVQKVPTSCLYVFSPTNSTNGTCFSDISYTPDPLEVEGSRHNICIQAAPDGERRCFGIDVVNKTDPCDGVICSNGGACMRLGGGRMECICEQGFSGKRCDTKSDPCLTVSCPNGECERINSTIAVCHCHIGHDELNCSVVTDIPRGPKAHFVQPSPGNGGVITCDPKHLCTIPMHYVSGTSGKEPHLEVNPKPPGLNITLGTLKHAPNNTHKYEKDVVIHGFTNGTKKFCMQLINHTRNSDDSVCYTVVSEPSPDNPDLHKPHFVNPTLQNNSVVPCALGTTCHIIVVTAKNGSSCSHVQSVPSPGLYVFSPANNTNGNCVTDVSYKPDPLDIIGSRQNICMQAGPDGEKRCFGINVANKTDPCGGVKCENGGACMRLVGGATECICKHGFSGPHCENNKTTPVSKTETSSTMMTTQDPTSAVPTTSADTSPPTSQQHASDRSSTIGSTTASYPNVSPYAGTTTKPAVKTESSSTLMTTPDTTSGASSTSSVTSLLTSQSRTTGRATSTVSSTIANPSTSTHADTTTPVSKTETSSTLKTTQDPTSAVSATSTDISPPTSQQHASDRSSTIGSTTASYPNVSPYAGTTTPAAKSESSSTLTITPDTTRDIASSSTITSTPTSQPHTTGGSSSIVSNTVAKAVTMSHAGSTTIPAVKTESSSTLMTTPDTTSGASSTSSVTSLLTSQSHAPGRATRTVSTRIANSVASTHEGTTTPAAKSESSSTLTTTPDTTRDVSSSSTVTSAPTSQPHTTGGPSSIVSTTVADVVITPHAGMCDNSAVKTESSSTLMTTPDTTTSGAQSTPTDTSLQTSQPHATDRSTTTVFNTTANSETLTQIGLENNATSCSVQEQKKYAVEANKNGRVRCFCTYYLDGRNITRTVIRPRGSSAHLWRAAGIGAGCTFGVIGVAAVIYFIVLVIANSRKKKLYNISGRKWNVKPFRH